MKACSVSECARPLKAKGLCDLHYKRKWRGQPIADLSLAEQFLARVEKTESCWIWLGKTASHGHAHWRTRKYRDYAHRWSYRLFVGEIPAGAFICHKCDVPNCVNPAHLYAGTHADNMRDMRERGRAARPIGEKHPMAKLNASDVAEIRRLIESGLHTQRGIAAVFGVAPSTISMLVRGPNWSHVK